MILEETSDTFLFPFFVRAHRIWSNLEVTLTKSTFNYGQYLITVWIYGKNPEPIFSLFAPVVQSLILSYLSILISVPSYKLVYIFDLFSYSFAPICLVDCNRSVQVGTCTDLLRYNLSIESLSNVIQIKESCLMFVLRLCYKKHIKCVVFQCVSIWVPLKKNNYPC